jgi:hypothetical protein
MQTVAEDLSSNQPAPRWRRLLAILVGVLVLVTTALLTDRLRSEPAPLAAGVTAAAGSAAVLTSLAVIQAHAGTARPALPPRLMFAR